MVAQMLFRRIQCLVHFNIWLRRNGNRTTDPEYFQFDHTVRLKGYRINKVKYIPLILVRLLRRKVMYSSVSVGSIMSSGRPRHLKHLPAVHVDALWEPARHVRRLLALCLQVDQKAPEEARAVWQRGAQVSAGHRSSVFTCQQ